ncbi:MAG: GAF domain-containing protein [Geodermatophilaceae bacterium]
MAVTNGSAATPAREKLIGETFVEMADTLVAEFDVIDFLHGLVSRTVELLDVNAAGIMLSDQRGGLTVMASSSEEARLLELYELQNDEGPCLDCFRSGLPVVYDDVPAMRAAWPEFTPWLLQFGFSSAQAIPMRLRSEDDRRAEHLPDRSRPLARSRPSTRPGNGRRGDDRTDAGTRPGRTGTAG